jgi:hypothetical protein
MSGQTNSTAVLPGGKLSENGGRSSAAEISRIGKTRSGWVPTLVHPQSSAVARRRKGNGRRVHVTGARRPVRVRLAASLPSSGRQLGEFIAGLL